MIHTIWKEYGETMTEVLDRCKERDSIVGPATYAGRLDPAAQGEVLILSGDERYRKDEYLRHDKRYTVDVILGISTDSEDVFGIITEHTLGYTLPDDYTSTLLSLVGTNTQPLPQFSGYRHNGSPLWSHTISGKPKEVLKESIIYSIELTDQRQVSITAIKDEVAVLCNKPSLAGFRINEIKQSWETIPESTVTVLTLAAHVGSGTYIRSLVSNYGKLLGIPACAYHITRTDISPIVSSR